MTSHPIYPVPVVPGPEAVCSPSPGPERAHQQHWWPTRHRFSSHATQTCHALPCSVATDGCSGSVDRASRRRRSCLSLLPSAPRLPAAAGSAAEAQLEAERRDPGGDSNATAVQWSDGRASPRVLPAGPSQVRLSPVYYSDGRASLKVLPPAGPLSQVIEGS